MREIAARAAQRARDLLSSGAVKRVVGWEIGEPENKWQAAVFTAANDIDNLVYGRFAGINLSKLLIRYEKSEGVTAVLLKPCDTRAFKLLMDEHRLTREKFYVIGVGCKGMHDENGLLTKCAACADKGFYVLDEVIEDEESRNVSIDGDPMGGVRELENMSPSERYEFWKGEFSRCIRCNACREVCPACSCLQCVFDHPASGVSMKTSVTGFDDSMYHIVRAFHAAGRCVDCGECSRVCPQKIPLHLINRKIISDISALYGETDPEDGRTAMTFYDSNDPDPDVDVRGRV